jgi:hypothetical protein
MKKRPTSEDQSLDVAASAAGSVAASAAGSWSEPVSGREFHPPRSSAFAAHYLAN